MRSLSIGLFIHFSLTLSTPAFAQVTDWHNVQAVAQAAVDADPAIRRIDAEVRAALERVTLAGSYPNPMVMGGVQNLEVDLGSDEMMTMYMVGISQTIPRGSRRNALRTAAEAEVRRIELERESLRAEVARNATFAWYDVAGADSKLEALREVASALDAVVDAARARYETGMASLADVVRAQLQRSEIEHQILTQTGLRRAAVSRLLPLLGADVTTEVPAMAVSHGTGREEIHEPREIPETHPALLAVKAELERFDQELRLANLQTRPDISVEASYGLRPTQTDMISVLARVELPFRRKTLIEPRTREVIALRDAAEERLEQLRRSLAADLGEAWEAHALATDQLIFHDEVLVPQSKLSVEAASAAYESGQTSLESVLAAEAAWRRLGIDYYDFLVQHIKAIVDFSAIRAGARGGISRGASAGSVSAGTASSTEMR